MRESEPLAYGQVWRRPDVSRPIMLIRKTIDGRWLGITLMVYPGGDPQILPWIMVDNVKWERLA